MTWKIVSDSSCDLRAASFHSDSVGFELVPLRIQVGAQAFLDGDQLSVPELLAAMAAEKAASSTACPSPAAFARAFETADRVVCVTISSNLILDEILGIKDLRSDKRIDFVGGIRGLGELKKRVDSGEMKVALALYPVSMKQLMDIADTGSNIMPPKTTWFEPKLRSGLIIHKLE